MARLKLHVAEKADFGRFHDPAVGGGLFIPRSASAQAGAGEDPAVGEATTVEVVFQGGPRVLLHGMVCWRRPAGDARTRAGVGVALDPSETSKMSYILGYVRGGLLDVRERRRLPVRLRVAYSSPRGRRVNFTRDLNEEGAFVRAAELIDVGARTLLLISPPGGDYTPIEVHGTVARHQPDGDRGMGVHFEFGSTETQERLVAFVAKLEADYLEGRLPDDVLL